MHPGGPVCGGEVLRQRESYVPTVIQVYLRNLGPGVGGRTTLCCGYDTNGLFLLTEYEESYNFQIFYTLYFYDLFT